MFDPLECSPAHVTIFGVGGLSGQGSRLSSFDTAALIVGRNDIVGQGLVPGNLHLPRHSERERISDVPAYLRR